MRQVCGIAFLMLLLSCAATDPTLSNAAQLAIHRSEWQQQNIHSYSFDYTVYGGYPGRPRVRIEVRADTVHSVVALSTGSVLPPTGWPTVDSLFSEIVHEITAGNDQLQVQYNSTLGFPVDIETNPHVGDGGLSINVGNFLPSLRN
jgi:Family of unknown function (DUF6174)